MRKYLILAFVALGLLMLGCTGQQSEDSGTGGTGGTEETVGIEETGGETNTTDNETGGLKGLNLEGMMFDQIVAMGIPLECEVAQSDGVMDTVMVVKSKGGNVYATGNVTFGGVTVENTYLMVAGEVYVSVPKEQQIGPFIGCQWLKIVQNATSGPESEAIDPAAQLRVLGPNYNCKPGLFSDSVFTPPRNEVCNMMEKLREMMAGVNMSGLPG